MPADTSNGILVQPENQDAVLWKYMDLPELLYLLQEKKLWFSRLDMLGDPFEGSVEQTILEKVSFFSDDPNIPENLKPVTERLGRQSLKSFLRAQRMSAFVSCWTEEDQELMALWRSYQRSAYSVAIRTTYSLLRDQLPEKVVLGKVFYTDFSQPIDLEMIRTNLLYYAIRKHVGFRFEKEIRAIYYYGQNVAQIMQSIQKAREADKSAFEDFPFPSESELSKLEKGEQIDIDINTLILEIRSSPICPDWFIPVLNQMCKRYGYTNEVNRSILDARTWRFLL